ncbi:hypothetical protein BELL_0703g00040 [Botrytis elliptica]|uniref:Uncharacterized protein n=1 Tax=Botrytis elliptica TaxID=278938 RepID=A0A4Z1JA23_9HELO|nr:hypothetical protein BELL_0703g00040 [Botrytis elliptica]
MRDPLLQMAGLPGMRSLGNGPLPDDGVDRTPTQRYLYNTLELYDSKNWSKDFLSTDGRVRYMERSNLAPLSANKDTFLGLPCDHKDEWHMGLTHFTCPSVTRFIPCGQKMSYYFNGHGCSPHWLLKGLLLLPLPIREIIYEYVVHHEGLLGWVTTDNISTSTLKAKKPVADFVQERYYGVPTLEDKIQISMCHAMGEFCWVRGFAEALRRRENDGSQEAKEVLIDFLGFLIPRVVWCVKCCNQQWTSDRNGPIIEKSLTWLKRNKLFHPCIKHISIDFDPRDEFNVPFFEDFVALCRYISSDLPNLDSAIIWLTIAEDDFQEVLKSPMRFSWVRSFRELRIKKVEICPILTKLGESDDSRRSRSRYAINVRTSYFWDFHHAMLGLRSLLINDSNNERELITHILTPGSKLWGYTDDIDDDAYISLQYMESWLSYTDDIADDAYISLQFMEGWNEKPLKPCCFRIIEKFCKLLRLRRY